MTPSASDKLRNNMDADECKHVVLRQIFLKYISDSFTELHDNAKQPSIGKLIDEAMVAIPTNGPMIFYRGTYPP